MSVTPNWANQTIWTGDNLSIMRGMNSESVDLIYLDPPFNSHADYAAPIGSKAAGAEFKDTWALSDVDEEWINLIEAKHPALYRVLLAAMTDSDKSYLAYMAARLLEMRRVLKSAGSIFLHCDATMGHYLKLLMDSIFGRRNFRNEIVWHYTNKLGTGGNVFDRQHDTVFWYSGPDYAFKVLEEPVKLAKPQPVTQKIDGKRVWLRDVEGKRLYRNSSMKRIGDVWLLPIINPMSKERVGYPTQKPLTLLGRIISASSLGGAVVLDPFCGCATTLVAAEQLGRKWVGIDISPKAAELVRQRITDELEVLYKGTHRIDIPQRTDLGTLPPYNCKANRVQLYGEQEGNCAGCRDHFAARHLEVDHIISQANGGTDHLGNLQLLCGNCNRVKGSRGMEYLRAKLQIRG